MVNFLITAIYLLASFMWWVQIYKMIYSLKLREFPSQPWDSGDRLFSVFWGGFMALMWPITLPLWIVFWLCRHPLRPVFVSIEQLMAKHLERLEK
jgi:hypothetical protein